MNKQQLKDTFLKLVDYLLLHGEMLKGLWYLQNPPSYVEEDSEISTRLGEVLKHMDGMETAQRYGKCNVGFSFPNDIDRKVAFQMLRTKLIKLGIKKVVDVGCYSGWMGKALSLDGIAVHGIDITPVVLHLAAMYNAGGLATFEYCPVQQLGQHHPKQFEAAIMFDVLEHMFDPELVLKSVKQAIKDGGWVFINLPHPQAENIGKRASQGELDKQLKDLDLHEHLYNFNETEIKRLMGKEKNFKLEVINNEAGQINWFIQFQI